MREHVPCPEQLPAGPRDLQTVPSNQEFFLHFLHRSPRSGLPSNTSAYLQATSMSNFLSGFLESPGPTQYEHRTEA